jgi:hypothetical protein
MYLSAFYLHTNEIMPKLLKEYNGNEILIENAAHWIHTLHVALILKKGVPMAFLYQLLKRPAPQSDSSITCILRRALRAQLTSKHFTLCLRTATLTRPKNKK